MLSMVRATAEACITLEQGVSSQSSPVFIHKFAHDDAKPSVAIEIHKKVRPSLRSFFFSSSNKSAKKTKRKDAKNGDDEKEYLLDEIARQRIIGVNFESVVELPQDVELNEWLATHTIKFFEHINYVYGAISDYCTCDKCALMNGPNDVVYQWLDDKGKKVKVTASQYIEYVTSLTQKTICDESVFPTKYGNVFPATFEATVKRLMRLLLHVLAHIYHAHFKHVLAFNLQGFINTVTLHFLVFCKKFNLLESKEADVLDDLYNKLCSVTKPILGKDDSRTSLSSGSHSDKDNQSRTSVDNLSQSSISPSHRQNVQASEQSSNASLASAPIDIASPGGAKSSKNTAASVAGQGDENKENVVQLSTSSPPVLTTQPNGHPRTPST